jgi:hypothetical protein
MAMGLLKVWNGRKAEAIREMDYAREGSPRAKAADI